MGQSRALIPHEDVRITRSNGRITIYDNAHRHCMWMWYLFGAVMLIGGVFMFIYLGVLATLPIAGFITGPIMVILGIMFMAWKTHNWVILDLESQEIVYKHKTWFTCLDEYVTLCSFHEFAGAQAMPEKVILHWRTSNKRHGKKGITGSEANLPLDTRKNCFQGPEPDKFYCDFRDAINREMKKLGFEALEGVTSDEFMNLTIHPNGNISGKKTYTYQRN